MTRPIVAWLEALGLSRYADAFVAADVELDVLADVTEADLERIGVTLGDRKRILRAAASDRSASDARNVSSGVSGERRQLTLLFCDIVGSTELAGRLDPEDLRNVFSIFHERCHEVALEHGGEIAQFLGDGAIVQFGFPLAHEDDAERAVRCALALVAAVRALALPAGVRLACRIGVATGTEVVGDLEGMSRDRKSVVGSTPSFAARLQSIAEPETVVISTSTRRLLGGAFELVELEATTLKGIVDPMPIWRVDGELRSTSRFATRHPTRSAQFVGRSLEIGLLVDRWRLALSGAGQVVLLTADAGLGKSRIVEEFLERTLGDEVGTIRLQCSPHYSASALQPVREFIERAARFSASDSLSERFEKLAKLNARSAKPSVDFVDSLRLVLALDGGDSSPRLRQMTAEQRKLLIFNSLLDQLVAFSETQSVAVVVEDLHWIDPTTLELVTRCIELLQARNVLMLATCRPEFTPPWSQHEQLTVVVLERLKRDSVESMVAELCDGKALPDGLLERIVERTDGVPLFVEELTKTVLASTAVEERTDRFELSGRVPSFDIPGTLRDALTARLDGLAADRNIAQIGAVLGRDFSADLVATIVGGDRSVLSASFDRLVESGLVLRQTTASGADFSFKHALIRDAAYDSLLRPRRQYIHLCAAQAIAARVGVAGFADPEIVAHHFEEAGRPVEAFPYWRRAADSALARSAYREAAAHLQRAIRLLEQIPAADGANELELRNLLGVVHCVLEGGRSETARALYERALAIAEDLPESEATFAALWGLCFCDYISGRTQIARERSALLLELADRLGNADLMLEALHASWAVAFSVGDVAHALETSARGIAIYDADKHHVHVTKFGAGHDSGACALGFGALSAILSGQIARGRELMLRTKALIARLDHPFTTCLGFVQLAIAHDFLGDYDDTVEIANESIALSAERKFLMPLAFGNVIAGAALARRAEPKIAVAELARVLDKHGSASPAHFRPLYEVQLALEELAAGDARSAESRLTRALATARELGGCVAEPEIHRALAVVNAPQGSVRSLEHIEAAAVGARAQGALLLELRAAIDRVSLLERSSDATATARARSDVGHILERLDPNADAVDLRRANALLNASAVR